MNDRTIARTSRARAAALCCALLIACGGDVAETSDSGPDASSEDGGIDASACAAGREMCGTSCVDLTTSSSDCGSCGHACVSGEVCSNGACSTSCSAGKEACGGGCVDKQSDHEHCGSCGNACASDHACTNGSCTLTCAAGTVACGGTCVDPANDPAHCGATTGCGAGDVGSAGATCPAGTVCGDGACVIVCPGTQITCNGRCVSPQTDLAFCGASGDCAGERDGAACAAGNVCSAGVCALSCAGDAIICGGKCIDPETDRRYCGASSDCVGANDGATCAAGEVCANGACAVSCPGTQINCGGTCVNAQTDRGYCGASGNCQGANDGAVCAAGQVCAAGACAVSCPGSQINCGGICVDPQTDRGYCGASGNCTGANDGTACAAGQACAAGTCAVSCPGAQINCGGTCIDPATDRGYCGASGSCTGANDGAVCDAGQVCSGSVCQLSCGGTQIKCGGGGGTCTEPSTDRTYCGASGDCTGVNDGVVCAPGEVCSSGACVTSCGGGLIQCGAGCVDPQQDRGYCGASGDCDSVDPAPGDDGNVCPSGQVCASGSCTTSCLGSQVLCGGRCVDPLTDNGYCGSSGDCDSVDPAPGTAGSQCPSGQVCSSGSCNTSCLGAQVLCGGRCIDPDTDRGYCGASGDCDSIDPAPGTDGAMCPSGQVCSSAVCTTSCPVGQVNCGGSCVDPTSDRIHCNATTGCGAGSIGSSGTDCSLAGQVCVNSACAVSCPTGQVNCGGTCINPNTDAAFCGAVGACSGADEGDNCATTVGAGAVCVAGACACPSGQVSCGGTCIDPDANRTFCGATGDCTGVDDGTDCALTGEVCVSGTCEVTCPMGQVECGGSCIDPTTDAAHCGAMIGCSGVTAGANCAMDVGLGAVCASSTCTCPNNGVSCGGSCVDPATNQTYCGATLTCMGADAGDDCTATGEVCVGGMCQVTCPGSQVDCGGVCVNPQTDGTHCGATGLCTGMTAGVSCGSAVGAGAVCTGGACGCPGSQVACGGACVDANTNRTYCGATGDCTNVGMSNSDGENCAATGKVCVAGTCAVSCPSSQVNCAGACVDPDTDADHCGASGTCSGGMAGADCSTTVGTGAVCAAGVCGCPAGQLPCGGVCVNASSNQSYCGATGNCTNGGVGNSDGDNCTMGGRVCSGGVCAISCPTGQVECGGACVVPTTDATHCGAQGLCDGSPGNSTGTNCASAGQLCSGGACVCGGGQLKCGGGAGTCIDPASNPMYCGATGACGNGGGSAGTACTGAQACVGGSCINLAVKIVFVTSTVYTGNLGGLGGADGLCQGRATAGNLPGMYKAWLSSNAVHASARLAHANGPYVLQDGTTVVANNWADLTDGTLSHAIDQDEMGATASLGTAKGFGTCTMGTGTSVFTDSTVAGMTFSTSDCNDWSDATMMETGLSGDSFSTSASWTVECAAPCNLTAALYCIQQ